IEGRACRGYRSAPLPAVPAHALLHGGDLALQYGYLILEIVHCQLELVLLLIAASRRAHSRRCYTQRQEYEHHKQEFRLIPHKPSVPRYVLVAGFKYTPLSERWARRPVVPGRIRPAHGC